MKEVGQNGRQIWALFMSTYDQYLDFATVKGCGGRMGGGGWKVSTKAVASISRETVYRL